MQHRNAHSMSLVFFYNRHLCVENNLGLKSVSINLVIINREEEVAFYHFV